MFAANTQHIGAALVLNGMLDLLFLKKQLTQHSNVYCTDGAYNQLRSVPEIKVKHVLGDFDSLESCHLDHKCIHTPDQEFTDFEKALRFLQKDFKKITVYGANGRALDHNLGNLSVALKYFKETDIIFSDEYHRYWFASSPTVLDNVKGKVISIVPMPLATDVVFSGLLYDLQHEELQFGSRVGTRNQAINDYVSITWSEGNMLIFVER